MTRPQKLNVIIEVELIERDQIIPTSFWQNGSAAGTGTAADLHADQAHEQVLLDTLRADPARYAEFIRTIVIGRVEDILVNRLIPELSQVGHSYTASLQVLEELLPCLPRAAQEHFQQGMREGWLSEGTESVFNAVQATPLRLTVHYPVESK